AAEPPRPGRPVQAAGRPHPARGDRPRPAPPRRGAAGRDRPATEDNRGPDRLRPRLVHDCLVQEAARHDPRRVPRPDPARAAPPGAVRPRRIRLQLALPPDQPLPLPEASALFPVPRFRASPDREEGHRTVDVLRGYLPPKT